LQHGIDRYGAQAITKSGSTACRSTRRAWIFPSTCATPVKGVEIEGVHILRSNKSLQLAERICSPCIPAVSRQFVGLKFCGNNITY
jgi:hypothetical protein